jgi:hypothetical protein
LAIALVAPALAAPPSAAANTSGIAKGSGIAKSGGWAQVTPRGTDITADVGLARGNDGMLHVLWTTQKFESQAIMDTPISATGAVGRPVTITSHWFLANPPDATATSRGLYVFWNGQQSGKISKAKPAINEATRPLTGGNWSGYGIAANLWDEAVEDVTDTAAAGPHGRPWVAFTLTETLAIYPTTDKTVQVIPPSGCCVYEPGLGLDGATNTMWVTYYSLISGHEGVFAQKLTSAGDASGPAVLLPKSESGGNVVEKLQRIGISGRGAGKAGVYVAYGSGYPSLLRVDVDRVGAAAPMVVAKAGADQSIGLVTLAPGPGGRLWVAWELNAQAGPELFVSESNPAATSFGKPVRVSLPAGTGVLWKAYLNARGTDLDILALTSKNINSPAAYFSRVIGPGA